MRALARCGHIFDFQRDCIQGRAVVGACRGTEYRRHTATAPASRWSAQREQRRFGVPNPKTVGMSRSWANLSRHGATSTIATRVRPPEDHRCQDGRATVLVRYQVQPTATPPARRICRCGNRKRLCSRATRALRRRNQIWAEINRLDNAQMLNTDNAIVSRYFA